MRTWQQIVVFLPFVGKSVNFIGIEERNIYRGNKLNLSNEIKGYEEYVKHLRSLLNGQVGGKHQEWRKEALFSLNGEAGRELRRLVALNVLRDSGAFFTSHQLANCVLSSIHKTIEEFSLIVDPSCGAGDLLLSVAHYLPLGQSVWDTCRAWGKRLAGYDKHAEFVNAAKLRLSILAAYRHNINGIGECSSLIDYFPLIRCADGLSESNFYQKADAVIFNPPFSIVNAPQDCKWGTGGINMAALFIDKILRETRNGTRVVGILPDVLRSGSRYTNWRSRVEESADILSIRQHGLFDHWADVDVFSVDFITAKGCNARLKKKVAWMPTKSHYQKTIGDFFEVNVGAVVPHRHKEIGPPRPFIHARSLPRWLDLEKINEFRKFSGTTFEPPFVAVRRTSSPRDVNRAVGTIVTAPGDIAVENHLIVLRPKDGRLETCHQLIDVLRSQNTDQWLNRRIRCRHLTVTCLREVPWTEVPS